MWGGGTWRAGEKRSPGRRGRGRKRGGGEARGLWGREGCGKAVAILCWVEGGGRVWAGLWWEVALKKWKVAAGIAWGAYSILINCWMPRERRLHLLQVARASREGLQSLCGCFLVTQPFLVMQFQGF